jgi:hypothetical protein
MTPTRSIGALVALVVLVAAPTLAGCQTARDAVNEAAQAASQATEAAAGKAIASSVTARLNEAGIKLAGPPDCTPDLTVDGVAVTAQGTVACTATTTDGKNVSASFEGSLSPTSCIGTLTIDVEGRDPITVPKIDGCRIAAVLGGAAEGAAS